MNRSPFEFMFYEDRDGQWRGRLRRSGMSDLVLGPQRDIPMLFGAAVQQLFALGLATVTMRAQKVLEPPSQVLQQASQRMWEVMKVAIIRTMDEIGRDKVAQIKPVEDPLEGVQCLILGHDGQRLALVKALYDPASQDYDFQVIREGQDDTGRATARSKRNSR